MTMMKCFRCTGNAKIKYAVACQNGLFHQPEFLYLLVIIDETVSAGMSSLYKMESK